MSKIITLPFLGQRNYLQGTTLYDYLSQRFNLENSITFKVNKLINSNQIKVLPQAKEDANAALFWQEGQTKKEAYIYACPSTQIHREDFDEEPIIANAVFQEKSVKTTLLPEETSVRTLVSLNKELHKRLLPNLGAGRWLFTRIDCKTDPNNFQEFTLELVNYTRINLTQTNIYTKQELLGKLYFSWLAG